VVVGSVDHADGEGIRIYVTDSGPGIDPADLPRLFAAFEQLDQSVTRQFGGLGLGLAISKGLVELHGGTIVATSGGSGAGATFSVTLPARAGTPAGTGGAAIAQSVLPPAALPVGRLRILLVEDHPETA